MVNKKFSDFESTNIVNGNEIFPTQLGFEKNRNITFQDLFSQIRTTLTNEAVTDCGVVKYVIADHSLGVPIGLPKHFLWCDGRTVLRGDNSGLVGLFIDFVYDKTTLRDFFNIPADKSSMKLPDLRDRHLVGSGSNNPIFSYQNSKVMDILSDITASSGTTITSAGNHIHPIADITGYMQIGGADLVSLAGAFKKENNEGQQIGTGYIIPNAGSQISFSSHRAGVTGTNSGGNHTHTATTNTTLTITKNTAIIDSINRVPAIALFPVIDINVSGITLDPDNKGAVIINISDVVGLQDALDSKVDVNTYDTKMLLLDGSISSLNTNKVDLSEYDIKMSDLDSSISSLWSNKLDTTTYSSGIATIDNSIGTINTTLNKYNSFGVKYVKSGLNQTINSNATALTNIINIVNNAPTSTIRWASDKNGGAKTPFDLISVANGFRLPIIDGLTNYGITFNIRLTGSLSGNAGTSREFIFYLRRLSDNSIVANDSIVKITDNNVNGRSATINSYVIGATDSFITGGFYIDMLNNSGSDITITTIELYINGR